MKRITLTLLLFVFGMMWLSLPASTQPPGGDGAKGGKDGKMGKGGGAFKIGTALPPQMVEQLKLTDDQKAKLAEIEKDLKSKLEKLLTDEQKKMVESFRQGPGGGQGKGGGKGGDGGGKGGGDKGDKGGDKNGNQPERPPLDKQSLNSDAPFAKPAEIQWFATLERGLAEAQRTGKPILFVSAAPHCAGVSGMW